MLGSTKCESARSTSCGQVASPSAAAAPRSTSAARRPATPSALPVRHDVDAAGLLDRLGQGLARPRRRHVDLAAVARDDRRAERAAHARGGELLGAAHAVAVVRVGLVPLDHRELGVVLERHALVAEVLAELVDPLEAAHDQALEVQLGGDAQVERAVELVVMRRERARARAAVERLQDRRLDLDEARAVEIRAAGRDHARAPLRVLAHVAR